jgi:hypothetical protein
MPVPDRVSSEERQDRRVRAHVYDRALTAAVVPRRTAVAEALGLPEAAVAESFGRLAAGRVLVLDERGEILMAPPFSAVPTGFLVESGGRSWWGNCIWDALGILVMLRRDGRVLASCGDCGTAMTLVVARGGLQPAEGLAHFAVPARRWWDDIVFT